MKSNRNILCRSGGSIKKIISGLQFLKLSKGIEYWCHVSGSEVQGFKLPVSGSYRELPYSLVFICLMTSVICLLLSNL